MNIDFSKGIHTNTKPINTPEGFYSDAENMRISGRSRRSEEGNSRTAVPTNITQWGDCSIGDQTIILGQKEDAGGAKTGSIIGSLDNAGNWVTIIDRGIPDLLDINSPTQIEGRKDWKGDRLIYFATPSGARRINLDEYQYSWSEEEFDKKSSLFLEYDLPQTKYLSEDNNGEVQSGVYQAAARLLTDSGAETVFGIISSVVPVVQDSLQSYRDNVNGAEPQTPTSKAITFTVENVDPAFKYIELGILTYVGLANTPKVTVMPKILINGRTSIEVTYRGAPDDAQELLIEDFITSGVSYETGKYVAQKDGSLLVGSPKEAVLPDIDWFRVAQNIKAKYVVKKVAYKENLQFQYDDTDLAENETKTVKEISAEGMDEGYKNPLTCALYKGYRRNEVYAFTMTPVFTSGVHGPTVHIPANHDANTAATVENEANPATPLTAEVTNLVPGSYDEWGIAAFDDVGGVSYITQPWLPVQLIGGAEAPTNLTVDNLTQDTFDLNWDAAIPPAGKMIVAYNIYIKVGDVTYLSRVISGTPPATTVFYDTTGFPINAYFYVTAEDNDGVEGARSDLVLVNQQELFPGYVPPGPEAPPQDIQPIAGGLIDGPLNPVASNIGVTRFTLSWDASPDPAVIKYSIYRKNADGTASFYMSVTKASTQGNIGDLGTFISGEEYQDDR